MAQLGLGGQVTNCSLTEGGAHIYAWYYKSGQKLVVGVVRAPSREPIGDLLNGHVDKLPSKRLVYTKLMGAIMRLTQWSFCLYRMVINAETHKWLLNGTPISIHLWLQNHCQEGGRMILKAIGSCVTVLWKVVFCVCYDIENNEHRIVVAYLFLHKNSERHNSKMTEIAKKLSGGRGTWEPECDSQHEHRVGHNYLPHTLWPLWACAGTWYTYSQTHRNTNTHTHKGEHNQSTLNICRKS